MANIYRILAYDSIMCEYFCIVFIDFMFKGKRLLEYMILFSPDQYKKNDKIILKYFQQNLNNLKCILIFLKKIFKEEESVEILKIHSLVNNIEEHQKIFHYA